MDSLQILKRITKYARGYMMICVPVYIGTGQQ